MSHAPVETTALLALAQDPANGWARDELYRRIEAELRRLAHARRAEQPQVHSLSTTELMHEAWLRLLGKEAPGGAHWDSRRHFFAAASRALQNLLVDHYRKMTRRPRSRDSGLLENVPDPAAAPPLEELERAERFLALHEALERLDQSDPDAAAVCRLRCFGKLLPRLFDQEAPPGEPEPAPQGLSLSKVAEQLGLPVSTAHSRWKRAVLFLSRHLQGFVGEDRA